LSLDALECLDDLHRLESSRILDSAKGSPEDINDKPESRFKSRLGAFLDNFPISSPEDSQDTNDKPSSPNLFLRQQVEVIVSWRNGELEHVNAYTYVWRGDQRDLTDRWDLNDYVRTKDFSTLSELAGSNHSWLEEEERLAKTMGMKYARTGDGLCHAVLADDLVTIARLVREGQDINNSCHKYGCALEAAAFLGNDDLVKYLIKCGADVNATGGQFKNSLTAAVVNGHEEVVRTLLKHQADPLADSGGYVSPVYQAVDFNDEKLVHLLLEKGAWLTKDYDELLDLAAERGNQSILTMLIEYDVSNIYRKRRIRSALTEHQDLQRYSRSMMKAGLLEVMNQTGQRGKWSGIKAVRVLKAVYVDGVDEGILKVLRIRGIDNKRILLDLLTSSTTKDRSGDQHQVFGINGRNTAQPPLGRKGV